MSIACCGRPVVWVLWLPQIRGIHCSLPKGGWGHTYHSGRHSQGLCVLSVLPSGSPPAVEDQPVWSGAWTDGPRYLSSRGNPVVHVSPANRITGPLFRFQDGTVLTLDRLVREVRAVLRTQGVDASKYSPDWGGDSRRGSRDPRPRDQDAGQVGVLGVPPLCSDPSCSAGTGLRHPRFRPRGASNPPCAPQDRNRPWDSTLPSPTLANLTCFIVLFHS